MLCRLLSKTVPYDDDDADDCEDEKDDSEDSEYDKDVMGKEQDSSKERTTSASRGTTHITRTMRITMRMWTTQYGDEDGKVLSSISSQSPFVRFVYIFSTNWASLS